ncbi:MAG: PIN domain-containing protein [Candidatus Aenigmarchaeota archaeon]|nr:PIN domain-containing protein [Candidatus Aenigmarchaeota archaeon]
MVMLLDTSAWIEFFQGTEKSKKVENVLKTEENFTSIVTFAEIVNWCLKNNIQDKIKGYIEGIKNGSTILELNEPIAIIAGKLNYERKKIVKNWGMIDSIILATAQIYNLKVLTKDSQFKDLSNVEIL